MDYPFTSDGCSVVADLDTGMRLACLEHDFDYWRGGTYAERLRSDAYFFRAIKSNSRYRFLAPFRWFGVRLGGVGWLPFRKWRWGYGWRYPRSKAPLIDESPYTTEDGFEIYRRLRRAIITLT